MQRYWILCWLTCISLLTGCAGMQSLPQKPEVTLAGVELIEAGIFEQTFNIKLRIHNPNNIDLPLDGITIKLTLNQQPFATASSTQTLTIPRLSSRVVDVAAISTLANIGQ